MYCIYCNKDNVHPFVDKLDSNNEESLLWKNQIGLDGKEKNINNEMVNDGIIQVIAAGYGSIHDGDMFIIAICDQCINLKIEDSSLLVYDNYMGYDVSGKVEKSKIKYRRRKNLDNLIK
jgi:hypothetical protein